MVNILIQVGEKVVAIRTSYYMNDPTGGVWSHTPIDGVGTVPVFVPNYVSSEYWSWIWKELHENIATVPDLDVYEYIPDPRVFDHWMYQEKPNYDYHVFTPRDNKLFVQMGRYVFSMSNSLFMWDPYNGTFKNSYVGNLGDAQVFYPYYDMSSYWRKIRSQVDQKATLNGFAHGAYLDDIIYGKKDPVKNPPLNVVLGERNMKMSAKIYLGDPNHGEWRPAKQGNAADKPAFDPIIISDSSPYWYDIAVKVVEVKGTDYLHQVGEFELLDEILDPKASQEEWPTQADITEFVNTRYANDWQVINRGAIRCTRYGLVGRSAYAQDGPMYAFYVNYWEEKFYKKAEILKRAEDQEQLYLKLLDGIKDIGDANEAENTVYRSCDRMERAIHENGQLTERQRADMLADVYWARLSACEWINMNMR